MNVAGNLSAVLRHKAAQIWSVPPRTTVFEAIRLMSARNVGALLVMEDDKLAGIVSERDYTRKVILKGRSSRETEVHEIMSSPVITARPGDTVEDCLSVMTDRRIRHLPVVEGGRVVGIVSIGDLVKWIISAQRSTIDQLEHYISGSYPA